MPSPEELATQPEYYLHALDLAGGQCEFLKLDKQAYRRSVFMDHRVRSETQDAARAPLAVMEKMARDVQAASQPGPINYIFHTAFCCSTLISRCLDIEGACYALREPSVLMQMANYKRAGNAYIADPAHWRTLLDTVLFLLTKSKDAGETVLIKPTNAANNLAEGLISHSRAGGVLLLYSNLEQFLISIIKKGEGGRAYVRNLFNVIRMDSERTSTLPLESLTQLTDLQMATFVWYLQMDVYLKILSHFPNANISTLNCDVFLAEPLETLVKLCDLFGLIVGREILKGVVEGPVLRKYSKNDDQDYDSSIREAEYAHISQEYSATINSLLAWSEWIRPEGPIRLPLPRAL